VDPGAPRTGRSAGAGSLLTRGLRRPRRLFIRVGRSIRWTLGLRRFVVGRRGRANPLRVHAGLSGWFRHEGISIGRRSRTDTRPETDSRRHDHPDGELAKACGGPMHCTQRSTRRGLVKT
jgi:hypothetical protein